MHAWTHTQRGCRVDFKILNRKQKFPTHWPWFRLLRTLVALARGLHWEIAVLRKQLWAPLKREQKRMDLEGSLGHHQEPWQQITSPLFTSGFVANYLSTRPRPTGHLLSTVSCQLPRPGRQPWQASFPALYILDNLSRTSSLPACPYVLESLPWTDNQKEKKNKLTISWKSLLIQTEQKNSESLSL